MGGMNLAVRNVTGKDPEAYFADYRNRNRVRMQDLKEAIGVESRSTIFNPEYIKEVMKGGASSASQITEVVTNTYGWNVTKPEVIDDAMWNQIYDVYVTDSYKLGTEIFQTTKSGRFAGDHSSDARDCPEGDVGGFGTTDQYPGKFAYRSGERVRIGWERICRRKCQTAGLYRQPGTAGTCHCLQRADSIQ